MDEQSRAIGIMEPDKTHSNVVERFHVSQNVI